MTDAVQTTPPAQIKPVRMIGIDVLRFLVVIPIIAAHTLSEPRYQIDLHGLIDNCGRFIVPFFFTVSGYFLGRKNPPTMLAILGLAQRLLPVFLIWLLIYLSLFGVVGQFFTDPLFMMKALYYGGPAFHLWFLPALGMSAGLVVLTRPLGYPVMIAIGIVLYCIGLATHPYVNVLNLPKMPVILETGPFYGYLFVLAGYYIGVNKMKPSLRTGAAMVIGGLILQLIESYFIFTTGNGPFSPNIFLFGTIPLGVGAFILSMHIPQFKGSVTLARLGQVGLGIYCIHIVFLFLLRPSFDLSNGFHFFALVAMVTGLSTGACLILAKIPYVRNLVK
jgi:surface polysaccharide O-acyltransferase-like enzyme